MFSCLIQSRFIYILSNLIVLPATVIPNFDFLSNLSFIIAFILLVKNNVLLSLGFCLIFLIKNNSNYRFNLLLRSKGSELSKSDNECVYLYAWCTILRYFLIGIAANQIVLFLK